MRRAGVQLRHAAQQVALLVVEVSVKLVRVEKLRPLLRRHLSQLAVRLRNLASLIGGKPLTPEKQQHLLDRLRNFNSLSPDKKQKILNRMETYEHLPPEKQAQAQTLFHQYQGLPADQRRQVSQAFRQLRQMSPEQRTQFFNSDEFHTNFNDQQRDLLRGMSELYPSTAH